jgi:hypothetical protein
MIQREFTKDAMTHLDYENDLHLDTAFVDHPEKIETFSMGRSCQGCTFKSEPDLAMNID